MDKATLRSKALYRLSEMGYGDIIDVLLKRWKRWDMVDAARIYEVSDGNSWEKLESCPSEIEADLISWVHDGDWGEIKVTTWINVVAKDPWTGEKTDVTVRLDPEEPDCTESEHVWQGNKVWGHGGGVVYEETCQHCGCHRNTDTWATNRNDGTQGHTSVAFFHPED